MSWRARTPIDPSRSARIAPTAARAAAQVVKYGIDLIRAERLIEAESRTDAGSEPTVLITRSISPASMRSTVLGLP
jgi:hypothetical protein